MLTTTTVTEDRDTDMLASLESNTTLMTDMTALEEVIEALKMLDMETLSTK